MALFCMLLLVFLSFLLIGIILLQRGRGGGLAGAFGGAGGQSAFGTRTGDVFTKITVVLAVLWVLMSGVTGLVMFQSQADAISDGKNAPKTLVPADEDAATEDTAPDAPGAETTEKPAASETETDEPVADPESTTETPTSETAEPEEEKEETTETSEPEKSETPAEPEKEEAASN